MEYLPCLKEKELYAPLCPTPLWPPWTVAHQAPLPTEFSRQEYWSLLPFPFGGDLPNPGNLGILNCKQILYCLSHLGSLNQKEDRVNLLVSLLFQEEGPVKILPSNRICHLFCYPAARNEFWWSICKWWFHAITHPIRPVNESSIISFKWKNPEQWQHF